MIDYLLDTNHASAVLNDKHTLLARMDKRVLESQFGEPAPGCGELWHMVYNSSKQDFNRAKLLAALQDLFWWDFDHASTEEYGRIRTELRRIGRPIPEFDIQIAAIARANDLTVLTADNHFSYISNLRTENWLA